jgi:hypothetical protein
MAQLPGENIDQVWTATTSELSSLRTLIPISQPQLRTLLMLIDQQLEGAEVDIIQALPAGDGRTWLVDHPGLGRRLMIDILTKRREVL